MNLKSFEHICKIHNQLDLKKMLRKELEKYYTTIIEESGFLYVPSENVDIMLTAHMDTVHPKKCKKICKVKRDGKEALWSPQGIGGDDRCGVFMILEILRNTDLRPSIVFCEDEEIGGKGSIKFANWLSKKADTKELNIKYIIELDRKNDNDAVFYDCGNEEFIKYITETTGYKKAEGSFSDIGNISPELDVASVNLSCGYYKEHTLEHYVIPEEMERTYQTTILLLTESVNVDKFDYQEIRYSYGLNYNYGYGYNYGYNYFGGAKAYYNDDDEIYYIVAVHNGMEVAEEYDAAVDEYDAILSFLMEHDDVCYGEIVYVGSKEEWDSYYKYDKVI